MKTTAIITKEQALNIANELIANNSRIAFEYSTEYAFKLIFVGQYTSETVLKYTNVDGREQLVYNENYISL